MRRYGRVIRMYSVFHEIYDTDVISSFHTEDMVICHLIIYCLLAVINGDSNNVLATKR